MTFVGRENFLKFFEISKLWIIIHSFINFISCGEPDKGRGGLMWGALDSECTGGEGDEIQLEPVSRVYRTEYQPGYAQYIPLWPVKVTVLSVKKQLWDVKTPEPRLILLRLCAITVTTLLRFHQRTQSFKGIFKLKFIPLGLLRANASSVGTEFQAQNHNLLVANTWPAKYIFPLLIDAAMST